MLPWQVVELNLNIIKYALAKARRIKRIRHIKSSLKAIRKIQLTQSIAEKQYLQNKLVIVGSTTQGNEKISKIDYKLKLMLDRFHINNKII